MVQAFMITIKCKIPDHIQLFGLHKRKNVLVGVWKDWKSTPISLEVEFESKKFCLHKMNVKAATARIAMSNLDVLIIERDDHVSA